MDQAVDLKPPGLSALNSPHMGIFRAIGFGIFLLIIANMMPAVFRGFQETTVVFFDTLSQTLLTAQDLQSEAARSLLEEVEE